MFPPILLRLCQLALGYLYPGYLCYKSLGLTRPDMEGLKFWCQYWVILAVLTAGERILDPIVSWVPMYGEAKLAFIIYLWYPTTKGASYVFLTFLKPLLAPREVEIDRHLEQLKTRSSTLALQYGQRAYAYANARLSELLRYVAAQAHQNQSQLGGGLAGQMPMPAAAVAPTSVSPGGIPRSGPSSLPRSSSQPFKAARGAQEHHRTASGAPLGARGNQGPRAAQAMAEAHDYDDDMGDDYEPYIVPGPSVAAATTKARQRVARGYH